jgi:hypothetical protein
MKVRRIDWYPDEWLSGVMLDQMTATERGVYDTIINMIYSRGGPITMTKEWPRLFGCHGSTLKTCLKRLQSIGKISRNGPEISVKRCSKELENAAKRISNAIESGTKGGRPPNKNKRIEKPLGLPFGFDDEKLTTNYQLATNNLQPRNAREVRVLLDSEFEWWWKDYPEKSGKQPCRQIYHKVRQKVTMATLVDGLARYIGNKPPDRAWLHPATWLRQERWNDVPAINGSAANGSEWRPEFSFTVGPTEPPPALEGGKLPVGRPH